MNVDQLIAWLVSEKEAGRLTGHEDVKVLGTYTRGWDMTTEWKDVDLDVNVSRMGDTLYIGES